MQYVADSEVLHIGCTFGHNKNMITFNIKEIRESKNISAYKLAQKTNMSLSYLTELENNKKNNPTLQTLCKIASVLNVSTKDLYEER